MRLFWRLSLVLGALGFIAVMGQLIVWYADTGQPEIWVLLLAGACGGLGLGLSYRGYVKYGN